MILKRYKFLLIFLMGIMAIAIQVPFLQADPDMVISESRDANTDEGQYTNQIRNYINHNDLSLKKSDVLVKTPILSAILFIPFKIFGTRLIVGRLTILLLSLVICLVIYSVNSNYALFGFFSFGIVFCNYYVFQYFHICLAEILSTVLIFFAVFVLSSEKSRNNLKFVFLSATAVSLVYYLKIQFLYAIAILPLSIIIWMLFEPANKKQFIRQLIYTILFQAIFFVLYLLVWVLPNRDFYTYVMINQTSDKFAHFSDILTNMNFFLDHYFYNPYLKFYTLFFYAAFVIGFVYLFISKSIHFKCLFIGITCWIFIELHKLTFAYLPPRYLVSLIFPMGIIITLIFVEFIHLKGKTAWNYILKTACILSFLYICFQHGINYRASYKNRTFQIAAVNRYLSHYDFKNTPVLGAWAPTLCWDCKAYTLPVWNNYFNDKEVIQKYKPAIIIAELDEEDSNQAFSSKGIKLDSYADSIVYFKINRWDLKLLWITPPTGNN